MSPHIISQCLINALWTSGVLVRLKAHRFPFWQDRLATLPEDYDASPPSSDPPRPNNLIDLKLS
jgi:hypothetical protein